MPLFTIATNVSSSKIPADFCKTMAAVIKEMLGKPPEFPYIMVHVHADQKHMEFCGSSEPCGYSELHGLEHLWNLDAAHTKGYTIAITKHVQEKLGIPPDRFMVKFDPIVGAMYGWNNMTHAK